MSADSAPPIAPREPALRESESRRMAPLSRPKTARRGGPGDQAPGWSLHAVLFPAVVVGLSWLAMLIPARDRDERD